MKLRVICRGLWTLYAVCTDRGDCPLLQFLDDQPGDDPRLAGDKRRMVARLQAVAQSGPPRNTEISHQIDHEIWQIEQGSIRVLWFYDKGRVIILSHGFVKSSRTIKKSEQERAREALRRYRETDEIEILED